MINDGRVLDLSDSRELGVDHVVSTVLGGLVGVCVGFVAGLTPLLFFIGIIGFGCVMLLSDESDRSTVGVVTGLMLEFSFAFGGVLRALLI